MATSFTAQVKNWSEKAKRNAELVHRSSVAKLYAGVVEDTPVVIGNARRSWAFSTTAMPTIMPDVKEFTLVDYGSAIASMDIGGTSYIGGQAPYLPRLNWGYTGPDELGRKFNQAGRFFLEANAAKWSEYVAASAKEFV